MNIKKIFKNVIKYRGKRFCHRFDTNSVDVNQIVTPWKVEGKIDYNKLIVQFGTEVIDQKLINRFEKITGKPAHIWIKRGIFFTHRGMNTILDSFEKKEDIFLYTGRGPTTSAMHIGHLVPFMFTKYLQDTFNCPLVIQISDEEKYYFKKGKSFEEIEKMGEENSKEIISFGFDPKKTFIFSNRDYRLKCKEFELLASEMKNITTCKEVTKIFGFNDEATVSMMDWPFYQTAAAYSQAYPHIFKKSAKCLIPHAVDQDPYFRLARDFSRKMNVEKPCSIMSKFIPPLSGDDGKMSSSTGQESTIFLNDSEKIITNKIMKYSFSGGGGDGSLSDHKKFGGDLDKDIALHYLNYFEENDEKLEEIKNGFKKGDLTCHDIKKILVEKLVPIILGIQEKRKNVDNSILAEFYSLKPLYGEVEINTNKQINKSEINLSFIRICNIFTILKIPLELLSGENRHNLCKILIFKGKGKDYFFTILKSDENVDLNEIKKSLNIPRLVAAEKDTIKLYFLTTENKTDENLSICSLINYSITGKLRILTNLKILISKKLQNDDYFYFPIDSNVMKIHKKDLNLFIGHLNFPIQYL